MKHYTVTLAADQTAYNLLTLVRIIEASFIDVPSQITITSHEDNSVPIYLGGDDTVDEDDYGQPLEAAGATTNFDRGQLGGVWAYPNGAANQKLNIAVLR